MSELETDLAGDKSRKLAYSDLQKHKLVIYHADNPYPAAISKISTTL